MRNASPRKHVFGAGDDALVNGEKRRGLVVTHVIEVIKSADKFQIVKS